MKANFSKLKRHSSLFILLTSVGIFALFNMLFVQHSEKIPLADIGGITPLFLVGGMFLLGTICHSLARGTIFPSFLVALFIGISMNNLLAPLVENSAALNMIVTISAVYILFGGGLEISFASFRKIVLPTVLLSSIGIIASTLIMAQGLTALGSVTGVTMSISLALLLGAILASTDPAAIIPVFKELKLKKDRIKDILVSESALTDVVGTLVTLAFITYIGRAGAFTDISQGVSALVSMESMIFLSKELIVGGIVGIIGFFAIRFFVRQRVMRAECHADIGFFIAIPIMAYAFAVLFGGSGYLASFIAGLLVVLNEKVHKTETFFNQLVEGIAKPSVFILLGALVNIQMLLQYAWYGILAGLVFMFIVRPASVFLSLGFFSKKIDLNTRELLFMSWVRETGVIPAVLLVQVAYSGLLTKYDIGNPEMLISVGMWVIIMTLVIQPPLTKWVARKLEVSS
jgi:NhaP-type Na+/H+ or K+/H+ antiporter